MYLVDVTAYKATKKFRETLHCSKRENSTIASGIIMYVTILPQRNQDFWGKILQLCYMPIDANYILLLFIALFCQNLDNDD